MILLKSQTKRENSKKKKRAEMSSYVFSFPVHLNNEFENSFVMEKEERTAARIPKPHLTGQLLTLLLYKVIYKVHRGDLISSCSGRLSFTEFGSLLTQATYALI